MARFKIMSKDGKTVRYEGKPKYIGTYLQPSYLSFSEVNSPSIIEWEVGDYVDYPHTGMRYSLYSIPQPSKKASKGSHGEAFTYSGLEFYAATKELDIALFKDLVSSDNNIHFSTNPDVVTFEDVAGIARRIQSCMDFFYPDRWIIRIADFDATEDAEIIEKITTAKDFALSGGTCLDALSKIYELWEDIGWFHTYENDKDVITIGYTNKRVSANTTDAYVFGKGNGLTAIKKIQSNIDSFATRLYIYGSERNIPSRYYNSKDILNAESLDIRNLMIPIDHWNTTDGVPDARKAYLENAEAVAKHGVIPKTHYFDSEDANADIYPTIERMTIGEIRSVMQSGDTYYPSEEYSDTDRADTILGAENPADDGVLNKDGKQHDFTSQVDLDGFYTDITIPENSYDDIITNLTLANFACNMSGAIRLSSTPSMNFVILGANLESVKVTFEYIAKFSTKFAASKTIVSNTTKINDTNWLVPIPSVKFDFNTAEYESFNVYLTAKIEISPISGVERSVTVIPPTKDFSIYLDNINPTTFDLTLRQIGFSVEDMASLGEGKSISMKSGLCEGRKFEIVSCSYNNSNDTWTVTCKRQKDNTLGMLFPNSIYPISTDDKFVLLDIAMPETYIKVAENRLLAEGQKLLAKVSAIQNEYEPSVDAKVMYESGRILREGMFMEITDEDVVDNASDYILIDTLNIIEGESAIPTYRITLRKEAEIRYKGTPSATSSDNTNPVDDDNDEQVSVDLTGYAKEAYVNDKVKDVADYLASMWSFDEAGYLVTKEQVVIKNNLIVAGDTSSTKQGTDQGTSGTLIGIKVGTTTYGDEHTENGILNLSDAFDPYYTKDEVDSKIAGVDVSEQLKDYAKLTDVDSKIAAIDLSPYATTDHVSSELAKYLPLAGGTMTGHITLPNKVYIRQESNSYAIFGFDGSKFIVSAPNRTTVIRSDGTLKHNSSIILDASNYDDYTYSQATIDEKIASVQTEVDNIEAVLGMDEEAEGVINTWNEVKAFLDGYSSSDDLAAILSAMNADIAKRALQTDLEALSLTVEDNAGNIKKNYDAIALLGTNKADKASTLAGYGITDAYTKDEVTAELAKYVKLEGSQTIKGDITIEGNLIVKGDTSSTKAGTDAGVAGTLLGITFNGVKYDEPVNGILTIPNTYYTTEQVDDLIAGVDVSSQLAGYQPLITANSKLDYSLIANTPTIPTNTNQLTNGAGYITGITLAGDDYISVNGYKLGLVLDAQGGLTNTGQGLGIYQIPSAKIVTDALGYTPLSTTGGTISGPLSVDGNFGLTGYINTRSHYLFVRNNDNADWVVTNKNWNSEYALLHSGNYSDYALPKSGGTIKGTAEGYTQNILKIDTDNSIMSAIAVALKGETKAAYGYSTTNAIGNYREGAFLCNMSAQSSLGIKDNGTPYYNGNTLIHSGNIGSQQVSSVFTGTISDGNTAQYTDRALRWFAGIVSDTANLPAFSGYQNGLLALPLHAGGTTAQLYFHANDGLFYRGNTGNAWKTIAFTDSNVASANFASKANILVDASNAFMVYKTSAGHLYVGDNIYTSGDTHILGKNIQLRYGTSASYGLILNSSGNVTIGGSDLAGTSAKLYVNGISYANASYFANSLSINRHPNSGVILNSSLSALKMEAYANYIGYAVYTGAGAANNILTLCNNGNVLIGTTTDSGHKLNVAGSEEVLNINNPTGGNVGIRFSRSTNTSWSIKVAGGNLYINENNSGTTRAVFYESSQGGSLALAGGLDIAGASKFTSAVTMSSTLSIAGAINSTHVSGLDITACSGVAAARVYLTKGSFRPWIVDNELVDLGVSSARWKGLYCKTGNFSGALTAGDTTISGNLIVSGDTSSGSDIRFKDVIKDKTIKIEHIAKAPLFTFKWNDREDGNVHLGSSAQYWEKVTPWLVKGEDFKTLDYSTLGVAMGISLAKKAVNHEERIKILEKENKALKEEIRRMRYGS